MKKITFVALHLGYGGIEQCISKVSNMLTKNEDYQIEIVSIYKMFENPKVYINDKVKITYLIESDLPTKLNKYKNNLKNKEIKKFFSNIYKDYIKRLKIFSMVKDFFKGAYILTLKRKKELKKYIVGSSSDIYISTHMFMNNIIRNAIKQKSREKLIKNQLVIFWEHNHHNNDKKYIEEIKRASENIDTMIVVSKDLEKSYTQIFKNSDIKCKIKYIPNFIENEYDEKKAENMIGNKIENINGTKIKNQKRMISIGRLSKEKGFYDLILVMEKIVKKDKKIVLDLIGDGNQYEEIKKMIVDKKLQNNIIMHGYLNKEQINKKLGEAKVYVMTSLSESFGLVLLEALKANIPCVAFDCAKGACEILNKENGILIENRDISKMADILEGIVNDKIKIENFENGRTTTLAKYSEKNNQKIWKEFLEEKVKDEKNN